LNTFLFATLVTNLAKVERGFLLTFETAFHHLSLTMAGELRLTLEWVSMSAKLPQVENQGGEEPEMDKRLRKWHIF